MSEARIGTCLKHGRNLASCEECGPNVWMKRELEVAKILAEELNWFFEHEIGLSLILDSAEVERLRAAGELRVACIECHGSGRDAFWSPIYAASCGYCNGTGWKWSEKR